MTDTALHKLCEKIGHEFDNLELLRQALRHPSFTHENPSVGDHNQRLEFLGDAVLGLVVAEALVYSFPEAREGQLTRWRAAIVSEKPLAAAARELGLGELMMLGKGENAGGGRNRPSLLCDAFEALVGASFLDGGLTAARTVIEMTLGRRISRIYTVAPTDYKSRLQEKIQADGTGVPLYNVIEISGPDHDRRFQVQITFQDEVLGTGSGTTKKAAEQDAAREALLQIMEPK